MRFLRSLLGCGLFISAAAYGGQNVGNGGHYIFGACYKSSEQVIESLDLYEAKIMRGLTIDLGDASLEPYDKVEIALKRLERVDPSRAGLYREWLASFADEAVFYRNYVQLPDVNDWGYVRIPDGCGIKQLAVQKEPLDPLREARYEINGNVFDRLDKDSQAALILHELVYRDALSRGHPNSVQVRYLTGFLSSREFESLSLQRFQTMMMRRYFVGYTWFYADKAFRYFDYLDLTAEQAVEFCKKFEGDSDLVSYSDLAQPYEAFKASAIGRALLGPEGNRVESVYVVRSAASTAEGIVSNEFSTTNLTPGKKLKTICRVHTKPW